MILQALYRLAEKENLLSDPDYEPKPVAWLVRVGKDGKLLGFESTHYTPEGKKKPVAKSFSVPKQQGRTSGDLAFFLCDKAEYVFGIKPSLRGKTTPKLAVRLALFKEKVMDCSAETSDEGAQAVLTFLNRIESGDEKATLPSETADNDLFAFIYDTDIDQLVTDRPAVKDYWKIQRQSLAGEEATPFQCLVSSETIGDVGLFPQIKIPGGTTSGVGLVSYNAPAFESHGWKGNENGPVSRQAAEACGTALSRLLTPNYPDPDQPGLSLPGRRLNLSGDTVVLYWAAEKSGDEFADALAGLLEPNPRQVQALYQSMWAGQAPVIKDESAFYALTLSGAQGRAIVRDWFESSVAQIARNVAAHFHDLDIVRNTPPPKKGGHPPHFSLSLLLRSLATEGDRQRVPAPLVGQMVQAALKGQPYPLSILQRALVRTRAEIGKTDWDAMNRRDARAALIKAVLNRRGKFSINDIPEVKREMDPANTTPGYTLGQLMAVLERLQQEALKDVNASVIDRYFSGASAAPKSAFVRLMKNARNHARKAKDSPEKSGTVFLLERLMDELADRFDPDLGGFPAHLDLEQQGLFVLGYHQMRKWLWMSKDDRVNWEQEHADAPKAYLWRSEKETEQPAG